jgi:hypothetical protein
MLRARETARLACCCRVSVNETGKIRRRQQQSQRESGEGYPRALYARAPAAGVLLPRNCDATEKYGGSSSSRVRLSMLPPA